MLWVLGELQRMTWQPLGVNPGAVITLLSIECALILEMLTIVGQPPLVVVTLKSICLTPLSPPKHPVEPYPPGFLGANLLLRILGLPTALKKPLKPQNTIP